MDRPNDLHLEEADQRASLEPELRMQMDSLMAAAPSDSSARLLVKRTRKGYQGLLKICSLRQNFVVKAVGSGTRETVESMFNQLRKQLDAWKRARFSDS